MEEKNNGTLAQGAGLLDALCPDGVRALLRLFRERGVGAYPVGGCVRDALMGIPPHDWDVAVTTVPEETEALCRDAGWRTIPTGIAHGTVTVLIPDGGKPEGYEPVECTTCRSEGGYSDGRHPDAVCFTGRLTDDLLRRDFTVNAMAADAVGDGFVIIDICGGREDLAAGRIRCVGDPVQRLTEDALRILRAVRFATKLGFTIEPETEAALRATAPGLARISRERVRAEFLQILCGKAPMRGMELLVGLGLLEYVLPHGTISEFGNLSLLPAQDVARLACVLYGMDDTDVRRNLESLRLPTQTVRDVLAVLDGAAFVRGLDCTDRAARRLRQRVGSLSMTALEVLAAHGQDTAQMQAMVRASEARGECVTLRGLAVTGRDLAAVGIRPGRETGEVLARLLEAVIDCPEKNTFETLIKEAVGGEQ